MNPIPKTFWSRDISSGIWKSVKISWERWGRLVILNVRNADSPLLNALNILFIWNSTIKHKWNHTFKLSSKKRTKTGNTIQDLLSRSHLKLLTIAGSIGLCCSQYQNGLEIQVMNKNNKFTRVEKKPTLIWNCHLKNLNTVIVVRFVRKKSNCYCHLRMIG